MISPPTGQALAPYLVSIIIPTYNSNKCIGRCLDSLREQTFGNYEVVIVDGGSTDGTQQTVEEYASSFSRLTLRSEKDRGVYDAMNKGIALAHGQWLLFLGSDDALYAPDVLAKMAGHLSPAYDFIYGNVFSASASSWASAGVVYDGVFDQDKILRRNICHQAIFYSRSLFTRHGGYDLSYKVLADWEFNLRVFQTAKKKHVELIVASFEGGGMSTALVDHEFFLRFPEIVDRAFRLPLRAAFYRERRMGLFELARYHWRRHHRRLSLRFLWMWLVHAKPGEIRHQAREVWHQRRAALRSS